MNIDNRHTVSCDIVLAPCKVSLHSLTSAIYSAPDTHKYQTLQQGRTRWQDYLSLCPSFSFSPTYNQLQDIAKTNPWAEWMRVSFPLGDSNAACLPQSIALYSSLWWLSSVLAPLPGACCFVCWLSRYVVRLVAVIRGKSLWGGPAGPEVLRPLHPHKETHLPLAHCVF